MAEATLVTGVAVVGPGGPGDGPGWLRVRGGTVDAVGRGTPPPAAPGEEVVDGVGGWLVPGAVDLHVHGGAGASFDGGDADEGRRAVGFHWAGGTTRMLATVASAPVPRMTRACGALAELADDGLVAGIHLEGPFLAAGRCGAQDAASLLAPDPGVLGALLAAGRGHVRMVTVAPELPGALDVVRRLAADGVVAALGHSAADYDTACRAVDAGATVATHLFNCMDPLHHRHPGLAGAALARHEVTVEVIADGVHLHPAAVGLAFAAAAGRVALVSDALSAAGTAGAGQLAGRPVEVRHGAARLASGVVAGSVITAMEGLAHAVSAAGVDLAAAVGASSAAPARVLGVAGGSLRPGAPADLVLLGPDLAVRRVWAAGRPVGGGG